MQSGKAGSKAETPPKKRPRHYSYDESVDEPAQLLEQEPVEIEEETPSEDTEPIEGIEPEDRDLSKFGECSPIRGRDVAVIPWGTWVKAPRLVGSAPVSCEIV